MKTYDAGNFRHALDTKNMVVALFYVRTCPFCRKFMPIFEKKKGLSGMELVKVDITDENSPLWGLYNIGHVPSVIIFRKGKPVLHMDAKPGIGLREQDLDGLIARTINI